MSIKSSCLYNALTLLIFNFSNARAKRQTSHEAYRLQMNKFSCPTSLAYDSAHVKCDRLARSLVKSLPLKFIKGL